MSCGLGWRQNCLTCQITDGTQAYADSATLIEKTTSAAIDTPIRSVSVNKFRKLALIFVLVFM